MQTTPSQSFLYSSNPRTRIRRSFPVFFLLISGPLAFLSFGFSTPVSLSLHLHTLFSYHRTFTRSPASTLVSLSQCARLDLCHRRPKIYNKQYLSNSHHSFASLTDDDEQANYHIVSFDNNSFLFCDFGLRLVPCHSFHHIREFKNESRHFCRSNSLRDIIKTRNKKHHDQQHVHQRSSSSGCHRPGRTGCSRWSSSRTPAPPREEGSCHRGGYCHSVDHCIRNWYQGCSALGTHAQAQDQDHDHHYLLFCSSTAAAAPSSSPSPGGCSHHIGYTAKAGSH